MTLDQVLCGALLRVAAPFLAAEATLLALGGLLWATGFLVFALRYLPILVSPRPDGRPG